MLLSHKELLGLITDGVITANPANVNSASIDICLGNIVLEEVDDPNHDYTLGGNPVVDITDKTQGVCRIQHDIDFEPFILRPFSTVLAHSVEVFNLPNNISAEYKLKSGMARNFLEHLNAGWCDAGWHGSVLTLELINFNRAHSLKLTAGMKIGQVVFFEHRPVSDQASYANRGQYNNDTTVTESKSVK